MSDDIVTRLHDALGVTYEGWELLIEAADEIERLRRWKAEAITVIGDWEAVWEAAGRPGVLGQSKSIGLLGELGRLDDEIERLRHHVDDQMRCLEDNQFQIKQLRKAGNALAESLAEFNDPQDELRLMAWQEARNV